MRRWRTALHFVVVARLIIADRASTRLLIVAAAATDGPESDTAAAADRFVTIRVVSSRERASVDIDQRPVLIAAGTDDADRGIHMAILHQSTVRSWMLAAAARAQLRHRTVAPASAIALLRLPSPFPPPYSASAACPLRNGRHWC